MFNFDRYSQLFSNVGQGRRRRRAFLTSVLLHLLALFALIAFVLFPRLQRPEETYLVIDVGTWYWVLVFSIGYWYWYWVFGIGYVYLVVGIGIW